MGLWEEFAFYGVLRARPECCQTCSDPAIPCTPCDQKGTLLRNNELSDVPERWGGYTQVGDHPWQESRPLTLPAIRGSSGIRVLCRLHSRDERDTGAGLVLRAGV